MQSLSYRKKTSPFKTYRNDPGRFFGDGVMFKAKLIGILEVGEARGDKMCQEALQDLKMAIRAAGEHKQRITIHVTIDGLRLRDEKTNDSLYHHPVHKISFIAQDMSDSRAFGYIFGSPDSGHRFFGIKTDKAASLVVLAMRDLFQVVFELKKKEIELARQQINGGTGGGRSGVDHAPGSSSGGAMSMKNSSAASAAAMEATATGAMSASHPSGYVGRMSGDPSTSKSHSSYAGSAKEMSPESVADLVDLEQELSSIQRGITQMERITPNEPPLKTTYTEGDPFGDSFTQFPTYNLLPPPESAKSRHSKPLRPPDDYPVTITSSTSPTNVPPISTSTSNASATVSSTTASSTTTPKLSVSSVGTTAAAAVVVAPPPVNNSIGAQPSEDWLNLRKSTSSPHQPHGPDDGGAHNVSNTSSDENTGTTIKHLDSFNTLNSAASPIPSNNSAAAAAVSAPVQHINASSNQFRDAFTDLDPLGTGKSKPYIDKKYFFQDLKNPPKKVLRDLSEQESVFSANFATTMTSQDSSGAGGPASADDSNYLTDDDNLRHFEAPPPSASSQSGGDYSAEIAGVNFAPNFPDPEPPTSATTSGPSSGVYYSANSAAAGVSGSVVAVTDGDPTIIGNNKALLVSDNDPFSPRMRKFDPFEDDFAKSSGDTFEFGFGGAKSSSSSSTTRASVDLPKIHIDKKITDFNGPLQVNLPPESLYGTGTKQQPRLDRYASADSDGSTLRSRPGSSGGSVFRQNTVDTMISSISGAKKMKPHLFSSQKYSRRGGGGGSGSGGGAGDSNTINMRRLQESDSMSENEGAPEPPPRSGGDLSHAYGSSILDPPPPLPPKKQFSDIVIRPRATSPMAAGAAEQFDDGFRYGYGSSARGSDSYGQDSPALPLPMRKIGRSSYADSSYPGPSRPAKKTSSASSTGHGSNFGDDYLTPIGGGEPPILLPPPQQRGSTKNRGRRQPEPALNNATTTSSTTSRDESPAKTRKSRVAVVEKLLPDITLSELLTLGIDELAIKMQVPVDKLSTMNIVELTQYLSDYVEKSSQKSFPMDTTAATYSRDKSRQSFKEKSSNAAPEAAIFKVSFDADNEATFIAKFDDNFGEDEQPSEAGDSSSVAVPNFANFNESAASASSVDRYAVFREIIEQEANQTGAGGGDYEENQNDSSFGSEEQNTDSNEDGAQVAAPGNDQSNVALPPTLHRIDTNITQVIAQAKDRYAALRDIIMVEDLFDKSGTASTTSFMQTSTATATDPSNAAADTVSGGSDSAGAIVPGNATDDSDTNAPAKLDSSDNDNAKQQSSPEINISLQLDSLGFEQSPLPLISTAETADTQNEQPSQNVTVAVNDILTVSSKDDLEINEYMNRAISNLSLESRDHLSPISTAKSPAMLGRSGTGSGGMLLNAATSPIRQSLLGVDGGATNAAGGVKSATGRSLSNVSTSPIQLQQLAKSPMAHSPIEPTVLQPTNVGAAMLSRSPLPQKLAAEPHKSLNSAGSLSDVVLCTSSPDMDKNVDQAATSESWAVFESVEEAVNDPTAASHQIDTKVKNAPAADSACSSDEQRHDQRRWRRSSTEREYHKRWPRGHTSSSSRDLSPWDDEAPSMPPPPSATVAAADLRRRTGHPAHPPQQPMQHAPDRHGFYMRHARRMRSGGADDDYDDYEDDRQAPSTKRRGEGRRMGAAAAPPPTKSSALGRSREKFGDDDGIESPTAGAPPSTASWYAQQGRGGGSVVAGGQRPRYSWSPDEDEYDDDDDSGRNCGRMRSFDRSSYERSTYGPPYEKRSGGGSGIGPGAAEGGGGPSGYDRREGPPASLSASASCRRYYRGIDYHPRGGGGGDFYEGGGGGYRGGSAGGAYDSGAYERRERTSTAPGGRGPKLSSKDAYYDRERRSFDCESNDSSFDYGTNGGGRRRSYGSGDVYGSLDSRESEFRDRRGGTYGGGGGGGNADDAKQAHRSLRKAPKPERMYQEYLQYSDGEVVVVTTAGSGGIAPTGPPSYGRREESAGDTRSLQRPGGRTRKSSGSSPWDGEELTPTSQKSWKRPGSAAESEKKLAELGRGPPCVQGSDGEKDRRFRKKLRSRGKELDGGGRVAYAATMRNPSASHHRSADFGGYEPPDYENDSSALAMSSGYRGSRRRLDSAMSMGSRSGTFDRRGSGRQHQHQQQQQQQLQQHHQQHDYDEQQQQRNMESMQKFSRSNRDVYVMHSGADKDHFNAKFDQYADDDGSVMGHAHETAHHHQRGAATGAMSRSESNKFSGYEDEQGFESDFNSPSNGKSLRFSNDFSGGKSEPLAPPANQQQASRSASSATVSALSTKVAAVAVKSVSPNQMAPGDKCGDDMRQTPTPKLRFDECVTVAKFDSNAAELFEDDDFSKAEFSFEAEDQWNAQLPKRTLKTASNMQQQQRRQQQQQQDNLRKSESVNIFAKKQDDPFEDDDFFKVSSGGGGVGGGGGGGGGIGRPDGQNNGALPLQQTFKWENDFAKFDENI